MNVKFKSGSQTYRAQVKFYTTEELKKIDEILGHSGSSQEAGFYFDELEPSNEPQGCPVGPYRTQLEAIQAFENWVKT